MLRTSVIEELTNYNGKMLIIQGTSDKAVHPETALFSYTTLLSKGKNVALELIEKGDYSFNISDRPDIDGWNFVIEKIIKWFNQ